MTAWWRSPNYPFGSVPIAAILDPSHLEAEAIGLGKSHSLTEDAYSAKRKARDPA